MAIIGVQQSDLEKISDAIVAATAFMAKRDEMNAAGHLASEVRYSPLTSNLMAERDRLQAILAEAPPEIGSGPGAPGEDTESSSDSPTPERIENLP